MNPEEGVKHWVFEKLPFPVGIIFEENNVAELVVDNVLCE